MGGQFSDRPVLEQQRGGQGQPEFRLQSAREVDGGERVQAEAEELLVVTDPLGRAAQGVGQEVAYQVGCAGGGRGGFVAQGVGVGRWGAGTVRLTRVAVDRS